MATLEQDETYIYFNDFNNKPYRVAKALLGGYKRVYCYYKKGNIKLNKGKLQTNFNNEIIFPINLELKFINIGHIALVGDNGKAYPPNAQKFAEQIE